MKTSRFVAASALALVVLAGSLFAAEKLKSGPQAGEKVPGPFEPVNINGETPARSTASTASTARTRSPWSSRGKPARR